ncbi:MAG: hypothetical protein LBS75_01405 [Synergistaceae bacterium]|nr:hypothetical protein [Synergistaceae bacterium]
MTVNGESIITSSLTVNENATLILDNGDKLAVAGDISVAGNLYNRGTLTPGAELNVATAGTLVNHGTITGDTITLLADDSKFVNSAEGLTVTTNSGADIYSDVAINVTNGGNITQPIVTITPPVFDPAFIQNGETYSATRFFTFKNNDPSGSIVVDPAVLEPEDFFNVVHSNIIKIPADGELNNAYRVQPKTNGGIGIYNTGFTFTVGGNEYEPIEVAFQVTEATPNAQIDYVAETLTNLVSNATYNFANVDAGAGNTTASSSGTIPIITEWFGDSDATVLKVNNVADLNSPTQTLVIPARPTAPTLGITNAAPGGTGEISGLDEDELYEYKLADTEDWDDVPAGSTEIPNLAPDAYHVRLRAVAGESFASGSQNCVITDEGVPSIILSFQGGDGINFQQEAFGYGDVEPAEFVIENSGNLDGTIESIAVDSDNFVIDGVAAEDVVKAHHGTLTGTVVPAAGLDPGKYGGTITVAYKDADEDDKAVPKGVTFSVREATPEISVDYESETLVGFMPGEDYMVDNVGYPDIEGDTLPIPADKLGAAAASVPVVKLNDDLDLTSETQYVAIKARLAAPLVGVGPNITVAGEPQGELRIAGSYPVLEYKEEDEEDWHDVPAGAAAIEGLYAGTYRVRVKASNEAENFSSLETGDLTILEGTTDPVRTLSVTPAAYEFELTEGYEQADADGEEIKIELFNSGNAVVTVESAVIEGDDATYFVLTGSDSLSSIEPTTINDTLRVKPAPLVEPGEYSATLRVTYDGTDETEVTMDLTLTVTEERTRELTVTAPEFTEVEEGYEPVAAKAIIIANNGNSAATISSVVVSSNAPFTLSGSGTTVDAGDSIDTWTIKPNDGLVSGDYSATITVTYDGGLTAMAPVSFTVSSASELPPVEQPFFSEDASDYAVRYSNNLDTGKVDVRILVPFASAVDPSDLTSVRAVLTLKGLPFTGSLTYKLIDTDGNGSDIRRAVAAVKYLQVEFSVDDKAAIDDIELVKIEYKLEGETDNFVHEFPTVIAMDEVEDKEQESDTGGTDSESGGGGGSGGGCDAGFGLFAPLLAAVPIAARKRS